MLRAFARAHGLSGREHEVLAQAAAGLSNKDIAADLGCSPKTVDVYWSRIFMKLGVRSRAAVMSLVLRAATSARRGLMTDDDAWRRSSGGSELWEWTMKGGREGNRRTPEDVKDRALGAVRELYADFGPTLAAEDWPSCTA
jgi:DNA-binding CsgD family transcriptional regulator